jgi:hypothetical protein
MEDAFDTHIAIKRKDMKRTNINVATNNGPLLVAAYTSDAFPGIAVHRDLDCGDCWSATHIKSGLAVSPGFRLRRLASCFARLACRLVSFTQSGEEIERQVGSNHELRTSLRKLAERFKS